MNYTFRLKEPNGDAETLIYFRAPFKNEGKTFVYSTGEKIHPKDWDLKSKRPANLASRKSGAEHRRTINAQLSRYANFYRDICDRYKNINEVLTIKDLREAFNIEFKKVSKEVNDFFKIYDLFLKEKTNNNTDQANSSSTIKRYDYNKTLLKNFKEKTNYNLRLNTINKEFYNSFIKYCVEEKKHSTNTLSRNIGLFKTFMFWALDNKYTFNEEFKEFKNIKRFATNEIALTKKQIEKIYNFDLKKNERLIKIRDLFVFGCASGMRYSNYSTVSKKDISEGFINVIDVKDKTKSLRIPLNKYSTEILEKYDYKLPRLSNQKFNEYIKELFEEMGYDAKVKKTMKVGNNIIETESFLYDRISSHTARRSFITIMKNNRVPDKVIMSYTGHKSLEVFNNYYRPNEEQRVDFMNSVFN
ncbi:tyrosine-type recombinase/integrase [Maribacter sp. MAR_2009_72]|uniref:tyrosine-type recombinase/integrase n=1 Tax=Maribacter sp. MAR_2009_72 TaxID=1250050 RepID=UPI00119BA8A5|nr:tyrosine-type recombinase/integrase [Maribacter sp. MAR_2009_72]TVZ13967.1 site-specific recombinase XerD [Maribacter sp. MAR_2009_72]